MIPVLSLVVLCFTLSWFKFVLCPTFQLWISSTRSTCCTAPSQTFVQRKAVQSCLLGPSKFRIKIIKTQTVLFSVFRLSGLSTSLIKHGLVWFELSYWTLDIRNHPALFVWSVACCCQALQTLRVCLLSLCVDSSVCHHTHCVFMNLMLDWTNRVVCVCARVVCFL